VARAGRSPAADPCARLRYSYIEIDPNNLAENYEQARGVPEDWAESLRWAKRSADHGNAYGMLLVGRAYQFGIGVPQSREEAIRWFERAAEKGDNQADY